MKSGISILKSVCRICSAESCQINGIRLGPLFALRDPPRVQPSCRHSCRDPTIALRCRAGALGLEQECIAMYYGTNAAGADGGDRRALAADASQPRAGHHHETRCGGKPAPQRTNWAWAAVARHDDWMDSHTPFAQFAHLD
ncbi:hypothetical protein [Cupriavidus oxalaticus]|uniref:Uncharacterized protein n=1 Tax=Cupriavidus oxalaticus TaxID=96344 RepID=A0ABX7HYW9_9BURK|nr:hypothetical protein [Cupriavidus oxalaticus]QRQ86352.1 hypothetical protein JTE91_24420 [Cupriavidus oxalaticus]QRQ95321.1 hypothetical protein JTE92_17840 [Cupriavidus oxalaticus]WQD83975.1 hypothetical protein U0036_05535 [Cupriavidus oxalaticus]